MAITIRNKETEELIRKIGRRTGEGPSAIVRRLAENEATSPSIGAVSQAEYERKRAVFQELRREYPPPDPKPSWDEIQEEIDSIYAYLDEEPTHPTSGRERK